MKIVLVIDQFDDSNNGTTVTARRFAGQLRRRGHEVVILAGGAPCEGKICAPVHRIPVFQKLIESQGMCFARPRRATLRAAMDEAVRTAHAAGEEKAAPLHLLAAFLEQECTARRMMEQLGIDAKLV